MVDEIQYTSIKRVLDDITEHPLLRKVTLEQVIRHTIRFIALHGYQKLYTDKIDHVHIHDFRGILPCDLIRIDQVKDLHTDVCLRAMTDTFTPGLRPKPESPSECCPPSKQNNDGFIASQHPKEMNSSHKDPREWYIPHELRYIDEPSFKTQGRIIYTSFPEGDIEVAYKSIPVDENEFPLLIDNEVYLAALEAYIKVRVFTVKFDTGEISASVLSNAQTEYAWLSRQLMMEFTIPSTSEMESITRYVNTLIHKVREFDNGFRHLGDREYLRRH